MPTKAAPRNDQPIPPVSPVPPPTEEEPADENLTVSMADFKVLVKMKNAYVIVKSLILFGHTVFLM